MSKIRIPALFLAVLMALALFAPLPGQIAKAAGPVYRAFLVGNGKYAPAAQDLSPSPENDVLLMESIMKTDGRFSTVSKKTNISKQAVLDGISSTFAGATDQDFSYFFYSGHGVSSGSMAITGNSFITPTELKTALDKIPGTKVVILDCCNSGKMIAKSSLGFADAFIEPFKEQEDTGLRTKALNKNGYKVLVASTGMEVSLSDTTLGAFTNSLARGCGAHVTASGSITSGNIKRGGALADTNRDATITLSEALAFCTVDNLLSRAQAYPQNDSFALFKYPAADTPSLTDLSVRHVADGDFEIKYTAHTNSQVTVWLEKAVAQQGDTKMELSKVVNLTAATGAQSRRLTVPEDVLVDRNFYNKYFYFVLKCGSDVYYVPGVYNTANVTPVFNYNTSAADVPNPFVPGTGVEYPIRFSFNKYVMSYIDCVITNSAGQTVRTLAKDDPARPHQLVDEFELSGTTQPARMDYYFDGMDADGYLLPAGNYTAQGTLRTTTGRTLQASSGNGAIRITGVPEIKDFALSATSARNGAESTVTLSLNLIDPANAAPHSESKLTVRVRDAQGNVIPLYDAYSPLQKHTFTFNAGPDINVYTFEAFISQGGKTTRPLSAAYSVYSPGWQQSGETWYYFTEDGTMYKNSWHFIGEKWYYFYADGKMATRWLDLNSRWYYMGTNGAMQSGWQRIDNQWYYLSSPSSGVMKTGWHQDKGKWYYLKSSGAMATGWAQDKGTWYYMDSSGAMKTGWHQDKGKWYYLQSGGAMKVGWQLDKGKWYYLNPNGDMKVGWLKLGNTWYYLQGSGAMATGRLTIDGKSHRFNGSGAWLG